MSGDTSAGGGAYAGRTLVVLNPAAGQGDPSRMRRLLGGAFAVRGAPFDLVETTAGGDAERLAREGIELGYRAVAAVGGDGTVAEVITGLAGSGVPLAIIPAGTGNQMAQNLGIPLDQEGAVEVAVHGTSMPIDLGQLGDGRYFALMAGAGWDADVMSYATRELKDRFGFVAYLYAGLRRTIRLSDARYRITADGEELDIRASSVMVANVGQLFHELFPLEFWVGPGVSFQDGLLDVCIFAPRSLPDIASMLWKVVRGDHLAHERMIYLKAREIRIDADPPQVAQVDGDVLGTTPLVARAVPGGVRVLVPE